MVSNAFSSLEIYQWFYFLIIYSPRSGFSKGTEWHETSYSFSHKCIFLEFFPLVFLSSSKLNWNEIIFQISNSFQMYWVEFFFFVTFSMSLRSISKYQTIFQFYPQFITSKKQLSTLTDFSPTPAKRIRHLIHTVSSFNREK